MHNTQILTATILKEPQLIMTHFPLKAPCPAGEYPTADKLGCQACPLDTYKLSDTDGGDWRLECTACEVGNKTVGTGSDAANMCIGK